MWLVSIELITSLIYQLSHHLVAKLVKENEVNNRDKQRLNRRNWKLRGEATYHWGIVGLPLCISCLLKLNFDHLYN